MTMVADGRVAQKVIEIVGEQLGYAGSISEEESVTPESKFADDLGADSLDVIDIVMEIEDAFGIEIPDEQAEQCETVQQAITLVEAMLAAKRPS